MTRSFFFVPNVCLGSKLILILYYSLLSPIGQYRAQYVNRSKGKREKQRKQQKLEKDELQKPLVPPNPEIGSFVDIGLSVVTKSLQDEIGKRSSDQQRIESSEGRNGQDSNFRPYSVIFIAHSGQPSILNSHLPQMTAVASQAGSAKQQIRLVGFSKSCQERLSEALGIPRVSIIGLQEGAPNSQALVDFVRQHVPLIENEWFKEAQDLNFKQTRINTIQTTIGEKKKDKQPH